MIAAISLSVSVLALFISALTARMTLFRRGHLRMTQPTVIYFGHDGGPGHDGKLGLKVYLRTLLYATAKRGCIIESMYIGLRRGEGRQNFNVWVYGEKMLSRGSGLFVPDSGFIPISHHMDMDRLARIAFVRVKEEPKATVAKDNRHNTTFLYPGAIG